MEKQVSLDNEQLELLRKLEQANEKLAEDLKAPAPSSLFKKHHSRQNSTSSLLSNVSSTSSNYYDVCTNFNNGNNNKSLNSFDSSPVNIDASNNVLTINFKSHLKQQQQIMAVCDDNVNQNKNDDPSKSPLIENKETWDLWVSLITEWNSKTPSLKDPKQRLMKLRQKAGEIFKRDWTVPDPLRGLVWQLVSGVRDESRPMVIKEGVELGGYQDDAKLTMMMLKRRLSTSKAVNNTATTTTTTTTTTTSPTTSTSSTTTATTTESNKDFKKGHKKSISFSVIKTTTTTTSPPSPPPPPTTPPPPPTTTTTTTTTTKNVEKNFNAHSAEDNTPTIDSNGQQALKTVEKSDDNEEQRSENVVATSSSSSATLQQQQQQQQQQQEITDQQQRRFSQQLAMLRQQNLQHLSYSDLLKIPSSFEKTIARDVARTYPNHEMFKVSWGEGQESLYNVAKAYSVYDRDVGYCQGSSFIIGLLLMHMPEEDAFEVFVRLMSTYDMRELFKPSMAMLELRLFQLEHLIMDHLPDIYSTFTSVGVQISMFASSWFLALFATTLPIDLVRRSFDALLCFGEEIIFRLGLALLKVNRDIILSLDMDTLVQFLQRELGTRANEDSRAFFTCAFQFKINHKKLKKLEKDYEQTKLERTKEQSEISKLRSENRKLVDQVRALEGETKDLADKLISRQVECAQLNEELENLRHLLNEVRKLLLKKETVGNSTSTACTAAAAAAASPSIFRITKFDGFSDGFNCNFDIGSGISQGNYDTSTSVTTSTTTTTAGVVTDCGGDGGDGGPVIITTLQRITGSDTHPTAITNSNTTDTTITNLNTVDTMITNLSIVDTKDGYTNTSRNCNAEGGSNKKYGSNSSINKLLSNPTTTNTTTTTTTNTTANTDFNGTDNDSSKSTSITSSRGTDSSSTVTITSTEIKGSNGRENDDKHNGAIGGDDDDDDRKSKNIDQSLKGAILLAEIESLREELIGCKLREAESNMSIKELQHQIYEIQKLWKLAMPDVTMTTTSNKNKDNNDSSSFFNSIGSFKNHKTNQVSVQELEQNLLANQIKEAKLTSELAETKLCLAALEHTVSVLKKNNQSYNPNKSDDHKNLDNGKGFDAGNDDDDGGGGNDDDIDGGGGGGGGGTLVMMKKLRGNVVELESENRDLRLAIEELKRSYDWSSNKKSLLPKPTAAVAGHALSQMLDSDSSKSVHSSTNHVKL